MKCLVVCPTYGRIPFLPRLLASFLSQDYEDKELVIVNDDKNVELFCDYENVTILNLKKRLLVPQKRNLGISIGYHDLIFQHDDDDIFLPNRLSRHVDIFSQEAIPCYFDNRSYIISGGKFEPSRSAPNVLTFTKESWFKVQGFQHTKNIAEDQEFHFKVRDLENSKVEDNEVLDYVYNWSGLNYHSSFEEQKNIDKRAYNQLKNMNLIGKKFQIVPDFREYEKFVRLDNEYKRTQKPINVKHKEFGKIEINV